MSACVLVRQSVEQYIVQDAHNSCITQEEVVERKGPKMTTAFSLIRQAEACAN